MTNNIQWLSSLLIQSPYYTALCLSEKDFNKVLKQIALPKIEWPSFLATKQAHATLHTFIKSDNKLLAVICLGKTKGKTKEQVYALLVHEAAHLWQYIKKELGETTPSAEFEAYALQNLAQGLFEAYRELTKNGKK